MYTGLVIEELIATVERAEREVRTAPVKLPVKVTRYEVKPGFVYAMQFVEQAAFVGVA